MRRYTGHTEPWGSFIDIKANAVALLRKALRRKREGHVIVSSVTDPYQPVEATYKITRGCMELLVATRLGVSVLTKSKLVERDIDLLKSMADVEVGLTVATDSDDVRRLMEPGASSIRERIAALKHLHEAGISTYVFVGPILPMRPEKLVESIATHADSVLIDRMNYRGKVSSLYARHKMEFALDDVYLEEIEARLVRHLAHLGVPHQVV
jgi:DNA repair photolyase